ncbi:uncharacterized protein LOC135480695 [Liolophura sinensis]|uniref:uncharacterized protein LOC135480695 n=1 Tax=Liolophura sinensis TaxID=3198878 RepID=UPI00315817BA
MSIMAAYFKWTGLVLAVVLAAVSAAPAKKATARGFVISIVTDGTYSLQVNDKTWLPSGPSYFYADGTKYSSGDGSLKLVQTSSSSGTDKLGQWQDTQFLYHAGENVVTASIRTYQTLNAVIFTQKYGNPTSGTTSGNRDSVASAFPSFKITGEKNELGYVSFGGSMTGDTSMKMGQWTNTTASINYGIVGGPLLLFDHDQNVLFISPFNEFMAASVYKEDDVISWGIMGGVNDIPAMYESSFIVYYSNQGINQGIAEWGALMRYYYGRDLSYRNADLTNNYLGFWTDNGAYYYYLTEKNKTYEDTIIDVKTYADEMNIPYRYVQYDSWWYPKGDLGGVLTWVPMPSVFPSGMQYVYNKTGWPVSAHNRWWSAKTTYAKQNGGNYDFIVEETKAIPTDKNFWTDLLRESRKWGLITYEQDWLDQEFAGLNATVTSISLGRDWLMQMGEGAAKNDLTIQYCMSNPRHILQSLEISVVTQARVSTDYHPGLTNWNIGISSIFADALGVAPFKDNFWTTVVEPGNKYLSNETHPALEAVVATLSTGPVGPSDMIGKTDVDLLMRCCNADGLILKPSRPARSIDKSIMEKAFQDGKGPVGEVWSTTSQIFNYNFGTILVPSQDDAYQLTPSDAGFGDDFPPSVIFKHTWPTPGGVANFSQSAPLTISGCALTDPCLWHTSPIIYFGSQVYLLGELSKWVPMSPQRVTNIEIAEDVYVTLVGAVDETVEFSFGEDFSKVNTVSCNLGPSGSAIVAHVAKSCRPL